ncbi:hypothetical protein RB195_007798 [Necator americanus]|uniref:Uncharacterized protein n=1 Tax=Necator americanus TaxID=51031 RepID=A0ABR1C049_NECAM
MEAHPSVQISECRSIDPSIEEVWEVWLPLDSVKPLTAKTQRNLTLSVQNDMKPGAASSAVGTIAICTDECWLAGFPPPSEPLRSSAPLQAQPLLYLHRASSQFKGSTPRI